MDKARHQQRALYQQRPDDFYYRQTLNPGPRGVWFRKRQTLLRVLANTYAPSGHAVDICCGNCLWNDMTRPVIGLDICLGMLRYTAARQQSFLPVRGDVYDGLPLRSGSVSLVIISETLEHFPFYPLLVQEIHRVLRPGGHVICSVPYGKLPGVWGLVFPVWCRLQSARETDGYYKNRCGHSVVFDKQSLSATFAAFTVLRLVNLWQLTLFCVARKDS